MCLPTRTGTGQLNAGEAAEQKTMTLCEDVDGGGHPASSSGAVVTITGGMTRSGKITRAFALPQIQILTSMAA